MYNVAPIQKVNNVNNNLYDLDGNDVYRKDTGHTEGDITEIEFKDVLEKVLRRKSNGL